MVLTEEGTAFMRTSSAIADGTVLIRVTCLESSTDGRYSAFCTTMILPPTLSGTNISKIDKAKQTEVENRTPETSAGVNTVFAHSTNVTALRCSSATPFG